MLQGGVGIRPLPPYQNGDSPRSSCKRHGKGVAGFRKARGGRILRKSGGKDSARGRADSGRHYVYFDTMGP